MNRRKFKAGVASAALSVLMAAFGAYAAESATVDDEKGRPAPVESYRSDYDDEDVIVVDDVEVRKKIREKTDVGKTEIPREFIRNLPTGNGDVTDLLRISPSVQLSETYRSINRAGEITPAEISISGGKPYQNLFLLDGMSNSSLLDPAQSNAYMAADVSGNAQKFFIDASLVEEVTVYDSNVPASYENFMGGVVDVKTRIPAREFGGSLSYRTTRSTWTYFYLEDGTPGSSGEVEPRFEKHHWAATLDLPVTEDTRFLMSYKLLESTIPKQYFNGWKEEERKSETFFLKGVHNIDGSSYVDMTTTYAPYRSRHFLKNTRDSEFTIKGGGYFASVNYYRESSEQTLKLHADYSYAENSRRAPSDFKAWFASPSKPWGFQLPLSSDESGNMMDRMSYEGGWGSIDKEEEAGRIGFDHTAGIFEMLGFHRLSYGVNVTHTRGRFRRLTDAVVYDGGAQAMDVICNGDTATCVDGEQYFSRRTVTPAADVSATLNEYSAYVEDDWQVKKLNLRLGVRVTHDDFMDNTNVAPRTRFQYDIFGDDNTVLTTGWNRYYSANLLANKLREGRRPKYVEKRGTYHNIVQDWELSTDGAKVSYNFDELKTPYSDEWMVGIDQAFLGGNINLKYIERRGKDEFASYRGEAEGDGVAYYRLNNNGKSEFRSVQFKWDRSWKNHHVMFNVMWQESETSNDNYDDIFDLEDMDKEVILDGEPKKVSEFPKENFSRPVIVNLAYVGRFYDHLTVSPIINYRGAYKQIQLKDSDYFLGYGEFDPVTGQYTRLSTNAYEVAEVDPALTVDCAFAWEQKIFGTNTLTLTLEVFNLFNSRNKEGKSWRTGERPDSYELGRQFWLGATYAF